MCCPAPAGISGGTRTAGFQLPSLYSSSSPYNRTTFASKARWISVRLGFPAGRERVVRLLVQEAVLSPDGPDIHIRTSGLRSVVAELRDGAAGMVADDADTFDVHVPMELRRRGGRKEIVSPARVTCGDLPPDAHTAADVRPRRPIVVALARAHAWQKMLDTGEMPGIAAIAKRYGVDRTYASRILALAVLAPNLLTAVLEEAEPDGLSLAKLHQGIPVRWDRQEKGLS